MWQKEWRNSKEISFGVDLGEDFKFHLVGWKSSCIPIRQGGLGIKCLCLITKPYQASGCGAMDLRKRPYGVR